ncbi:TonB-dependent receptor [Serratia marcescens]|nr:TonB-dependent receptor [Serratia marcescens]
MKYELSVFNRAILLALSVSAAPVVAFAENRTGPASDTTVQELRSVTVTADKIERLIEQVPASIVVIDGWDIEQSGITEMEQLEGRVACLSFQPFGQPGMKAPVMRGLTASIHSFSTSVRMLVDGVPTLDAANQYQRNGYGLVNLVAGYQRGDWEIAAYANNVGNKTYDAAGHQGGYVTIYSPPREVGGRLTWRM